MAAQSTEEALGALGLRIQELRRARGETQETFAAALGMLTPNFARIEQGRANVTVDTLVRIANALCVAPAELLVTPSRRGSHPGRPRRDRLTSQPDPQRVGTFEYLPPRGGTGPALRVSDPARAASERKKLLRAVAHAPRGIVCLLSALHFHGLSAKAPAAVWVLVDGKARKPAEGPPRLHVARATGRALAFGVEEHLVDGQPVRVTSAAKTVADCFKYRNKIGVSVARDALRAYLRGPARNLAQLSAAAEVCRVSRVMQPYLDALL